MTDSERLEARQHAVRHRAIERARRERPAASIGKPFGEIAEAWRKRHGVNIPTDPAEVDAAIARGEAAYRQEIADAAARRRANMLGRLPNLYRDAELPKTPSGVVAYRWLRDYRAGRRQPLVIVGHKGTGKTWHACALARTLLTEDSVPVMFTPAEELLERLRPDPDTPIHGDMIQFATAPVLIVDDLGSESTTPWAAQQMFRLANERAQNTRPTIFTSNLNGDGLRARYEERTFERMFGGAALITITGPSRRSTPFD